MAPTATRSYYLPEDVASQIEARTPPGWSASAVLTRIVRRYAHLMDISTPDLDPIDWEELETVEFGFADKHGYGLDPVRRMTPELRLKISRLPEAQRMAIWDHLVETARNERPIPRSTKKKGAPKR